MTTAPGTYAELDWNLACRHGPKGMSRACAECQAAWPCPTAQVVEATIRAARATGAPERVIHRALAGFQRRWNSPRGR